MVGIVVFHVLILLLVLASRIVPSQHVKNVLGYLHSTVGVTSPPMEQVRLVALIWIASIIVIVDGCLLLLVAVVRLSTER